MPAEDTQFTPENAAEMGRRSAEARKSKRSQRQGELDELLIGLGLDPQDSLLQQIARAALDGKTQAMSLLLKLAGRDPNAKTGPPDRPVEVHLSEIVGRDLVRILGSGRLDLPGPDTLALGVDQTVRIDLPDGRKLWVRSDGSTKIDP